MANGVRTSRYGDLFDEHTALTGDALHFRYGLVESVMRSL
jgi:hypothetical protein